jgi:hypothetical protein
MQDWTFSMPLGRLGVESWTQAETRKPAKIRNKTDNRVTHLTITTQIGARRRAERQGLSKIIFIDPWVNHLY